MNEENLTDKKIDDIIKTSKKDEVKKLKSLKKAEKERVKALKRFMKKIGVTKKDSQEQINQKVLKFASETKIPFEIRLSDVQKNDKSFLLKLYQANTDCTNWQKPNEEHQKDVDFMIEFFQVAYEQKKKTYSRFMKVTLYEVASDYKDVLKNPLFVEKMEKAFPDENLLEILTQCLDSYFIHKENPYREAVFAWPYGVLKAQAQKFGKDFLKYLPKDYPNYTRLVAAAAEKDGFDSLTYLPIKKVLKKKDLILKAHTKDGVERLVSYLKKDLSPRREQFYWCHGEPHYYSYHSKEHEKVQESLLSDKDIRKIVNPYFKKQQEAEKAAKKKTNQLKNEGKDF